MSQSRFVSEINVTPFVDVMLVMLIIFMVATPMMSEGLDVDLPQTKQVEVLPTDQDRMVLTIRKDASIYLDEYRVENIEQLEGFLTTNVKAKDKTLYLKADKEVAYGIVVDVMGRIKAAGIEKIGVMAENVATVQAAAQSATQPQANPQAPASTPARSGSRK